MMKLKAIIAEAKRVEFDSSAPREIFHRILLCMEERSKFKEKIISSPDIYRPHLYEKFLQPL